MDLVLEKRIGRKKRVLVYKEKSPRLIRWAMWCNAIWKICIISDDYVNELNFDFWTCDMDEVYKWYFVSFLGINDSKNTLYITEDESNKWKEIVWFIAIPKTISVPVSAWIFERWVTKEVKVLWVDEALEIAKTEIREYNAYLEGKSYVWIEERLVTRTSEDWREEYRRERVWTPILWFITIEDTVNYFS